MKKIIALLLAAVMVMCLFAGCASSGGSKVIKIGVFEPQSGDNGAGGKQEVLGIQYANSVKPTVTINGEEYKIELDIQDNQSSTDKAVSAAQQLVADKVSVVLGSYGSGVSIAAGTYFANAKIPAIGCSCTNAAVTAGNDYYFRVCFLDPFQGSVMASFAMEEFGAKKAYVLSMLGDDYTVGLAKNFVIAFEAAGGDGDAGAVGAEDDGDLVGNQLLGRGDGLVGRGLVILDVELDLVFFAANGHGRLDGVGVLDAQDLLLAAGAVVAGLGLEHADLYDLVAGAAAVVRGIGDSAAVVGRVARGGGGLAAGGQRKHHAQSKQECKYLLHSVSSS